VLDCEGIEVFRRQIDVQYFWQRITDANVFFSDTRGTEPDCAVYRSGVLLLSRAGAVHPSVIAAAERDNDLVVLRNERRELARRVLAQLGCDS
jgi:hypothetical protein